MKDTYSVKDLQRETAAAIRTAESGTLVTVTRHDRPVVHVISAARLGGLLESMELLADDKFKTHLKRLRAGKVKFQPATTLAVIFFFPDFIFFRHRPDLQLQLHP